MDAIGDRLERLEAGLGSRRRAYGLPALLTYGVKLSYLFVCGFPKTYKAELDGRGRDFFLALTTPPETDWSGSSVDIGARA